MIYILIGIVIIFFFLIISLISGKILTSRRPPDPPDDPGNYGLGYENVTFPSRYKAQLGGWWIPADSDVVNGTIIFCHGQNGSMDSDLKQAVPLNQAGYNVLMFNFRAHGNSEGDTVTFGVFEKDDLLGAVDFLVENKGVENVAVMGFSMGAGVAMIGAALDKRITTLVLDGAFLRFVDTLEAWMRTRYIPPGISGFLAQLMLFGASLITNTRMYQISPRLWARHLDSTPVLFIHGESDRLIPESAVQKLASDLKGEYQIWVAPGSDHRQAFGNHTEEYNRRVIAWLEKHAR